MTIGKMYLIACMLDGIKILLAIVFAIGVVAAFVNADFYFNKIGATNEEMRKAGRNSKILLVICIFIGMLSLLTPAKKDFMIIALTKDYTVEQAGEMTEEQFKSGIDYLFKKLDQLEKSVVTKYQIKGEWLKAQLEEGRSNKDIAEEVGCDASLISKYKSRLENDGRLYS